MMDEVVPGLFSDVKYYIVGEIDDKVSIEIPKVDNVKMRTWIVCRKEGRKEEKKVVGRKEGNEDTLDRSQLKKRALFIHSN